VSSFLTELRVRPLPDGKTWELCEGFQYYTDELPVEQIIAVPAGFRTDFNSTPRPLWWLFPPWGKYGKAAVIHDFLYQLKAWSRGRCDAIFLDAMTVLGVGWFTRTTMYAAVRACGWIAWRKRPVKQHVEMFAAALIVERVRIQEVV
jgi:hypothetical protein